MVVGWYGAVCICTATLVLEMVVGWYGPRCSCIAVRWYCVLYWREFSTDEGGCLYQEGHDRETKVVKLTRGVVLK
eukprot:1444833-Rhodomonas_salina.1